LAAIAPRERRSTVRRYDRRRSWNILNGDSLVERIFRFSITLNGLYAVLELILGITILKVNPQMMNRMVLGLLHQKLFMNPGDFVATHLLRATQQFAEGGKHSASVYLLSHGVSKLIVVLSLLRNKLWSYPFLILMSAGFILFQGYRYVLTHSLVMIFLIICDLIVIALAWLEYGKQKLRSVGNSKDA
jgi:uncharacterized membrane protein